MPTRNGDADGDLVCHQAHVWSFGSASFPFDTGFHSVRVGITLHSQENRYLPHGGCPPELGLERPRNYLELLCPRPDIELLSVLVMTFVKFRDGVPTLFQSVIVRKLPHL